MNMKQQYIIPTTTPFRLESEGAPLMATSGENMNENNLGEVIILTD